MQIAFRIPVIAFVVHAFAICAFAAFGSIFHGLPVWILGLVYAIALLAALAPICRSSQEASVPLAARVAALHVLVSAVLIALGFAEEILPVVGGILSFASAMFFFVLNYPGLAVTKLLPYRGPSGLWMLLSNSLMVFVTAAWLFLAVVIARAVSRWTAVRAQNAA